jgi:RNA polymerase sigma-70 factor (sigma-E family)
MDRPSRQDALAALYRLHYAELARLGFALTGDWAQAEEIAQEAFVRTWRSWGRIRREQSAPAYLRATVVNLSRTSLRRRLREIRAWQGLAGPASTNYAADGNGEPGADLLGALQQLPARKRACVVLRFCLDMSEAETAATLGVSVGTVKSQTAKALQRLRELLDAVEMVAPQHGGSDE